MTESLYDAAKRSRNPFTVEAFLNIATADEMLGLVPFIDKGGESFAYNREKALGSFGFVSDGHTSVSASEGTDETVTVAKREAVADFYVRNFAQSNLAGQISPLERQTQMKFKAAGRTIAQTMIGGGYITGITLGSNFAGGVGVDALVSASAFMDSNRNGLALLKYVHSGTLLSFQAPGDRTFGPAVDISGGDGDFTLVSDNPSKWVKLTLDVSDFSANGETTIAFTSSTNEFDGLATLMSSSQIRTSTGANGDVASFAILDELSDSVKARDNLAYIMPAALRNKYNSLLRNGGGVDPIDIMDGKYKVPSYNGIPILKNDWIASTEAKGSATTLSSVYLVSLSAEDGFWMGCLGDTFDVMSDPRGATVKGFRLEELGQSQAGASSVGRRLMFFGGAALGSNLAAARASEIITA